MSDDIKALKQVREGLERSIASHDKLRAEKVSQLEAVDRAIAALSEDRERWVVNPNAAQDGQKLMVEIPRGFDAWPPPDTDALLGQTIEAVFTTRDFAIWTYGEHIDFEGHRPYAYRIVPPAPTTVSKSKWEGVLLDDVSRETSPVQSASERDKAYQDDSGGYTAVSSQWRVWPSHPFPPPPEMPGYAIERKREAGIDCYRYMPSDINPAPEVRKEDEQDAAAKFDASEIESEASNLSSFELEYLVSFCGLTEAKPWGAAMSAVMETLAGYRMIAGESDATPTALGRAVASWSFYGDASSGQPPPQEAPAIPEGGAQGVPSQYVADDVPITVDPETSDEERAGIAIAEGYRAGLRKDKRDSSHMQEDRRALWRWGYDVARDPTGIGPEMGIPFGSPEDDPGAQAVTEYEPQPADIGAALSGLDSQGIQQDTTEQTEHDRPKLTNEEFESLEKIDGVLDAEPSPILRSEVPPAAETYLAPSGDEFATVNGQTHLIVSDEAEAQGQAETAPQAAYAPIHNEDEPSDAAVFAHGLNVEIDQKADNTNPFNPFRIFGGAKKTLVGEGV